MRSDSTRDGDHENLSIELSVFCVFIPPSSGETVAINHRFADTCNAYVLIVTAQSTNEIN